MTLYDAEAKTYNMAKMIVTSLGAAVRALLRGLNYFQFFLLFLVAGCGSAPDAARRTSSAVTY